MFPSATVYLQNQKPVKWMAPECYEFMQNCSTMSDVWSYGRRLELVSVILNTSYQFIYVEQIEKASVIFLYRTESISRD